MKEQSFFKKRVGSVGASQIVGLVYYYRNATSLDFLSQSFKKLIDDLNNKYFETPFSIKEKIKMSHEELRAMSEKFSTASTKRGNRLESAVLEHFLESNSNLIKIDEQVSCEKQYQNFKARATIDYICADEDFNNIIVEVKTRNKYMYSNLTSCLPQDIWQLAMQIMLKEDCNVGLIATQIVDLDDDGNDLLIGDIIINSFTRKMLQPYIETIKQVLQYFDDNFNESFTASDCQKDLQVLEFKNMNVVINKIENSTLEKIKRCEELKQQNKDILAEIEQLENDISKEFKAIADQHKGLSIFEAEGFKYEASWTKPSYWTESDIASKQNELKSVQVGDIKTKSTLRLLKK